MKYQVNVNVSIQEAPTDDGRYYSSSMLTYHKNFTLTGDKFSDLAPRIDAVVESMDLVADEMEKYSAGSDKLGNTNADSPASGGSGSSESVRSER